MITRNTRLTAIVLAGMSLFLAVGSAGAQTPILYTGDISPTFGSVNDTCTFEITLWDATADGTRIGPVIERELGVRGGLYETDLDFGPEVFEEGSRYLEVAVGCPAGRAALTTLTRRAFHPASGTRSRRGDSEQTATQGQAVPSKAALGTGFTYQGELKQSGAPVTGSGDFQFSLWDAVSGGAQIGATVPASSIAVEDGRFTAQLDFGAAAFDGDARWLEIAVDYPSGTGSLTTLSPRQPLNAAPYALQTRGIFVDDTGKVGVGTTNPQVQLHIEADASQTLRVRNNATSGGVALSATATADSGWATAIDAYTASPGGVGVSSFNEAESGNAFAMAAETNSPDGIAIFGHASNGDEYSTGIGLSGRSDSDYGGTGVYGEATASGGGTYGVRGVSATGSGVRGDHQATGNYGHLGTSTSGVVGHVISTSDYAGYFTGGQNYFEGRVGIGTENPATDLHVAGGARVEGDLRINGGGSISFVDTNTRIYEVSDDLYLEADSDIIIQPDRDVSMDSGTLYVDSSVNRVGVGTSTPAEALDVVGDVRTNGDYTFTPNRVYTLNVGAHSFRNGYQATSTTAWVSNDHYGHIASGVPPLAAAITAQVHLPEGAVIQEFRVYYQDNETSHNVHVTARLTPINVETGGGYNMANIEDWSSGSSTDILSLYENISSASPVDNAQNRYWINVFWEPDAESVQLFFYGCRIVYSISTLNP